MTWMIQLNWVLGYMKGSLYIEFSKGGKIQKFTKAFYLLPCNKFLYAPQFGFYCSATFSQNLHQYSPTCFLVTRHRMNWMSSWTDAAPSSPSRKTLLSLTRTLSCLPEASLSLNPELLWMPTWRLSTQWFLSSSSPPSPPSPKSLRFLCGFGHT